MIKHTHTHANKQTNPLADQRGVILIAESFNDKMEDDTHQTGDSERVR